MRRRALFASALSAPALLLGDPRAVPQGIAESARAASMFDETTVPTLAESLAARPHRRRDNPLPRPFARLDYDAYRRIQFDAAQALWRAEGLPFQLQPHHRGFLFEDRVDIFEVAEGRATPLAYRAEQFRFDGIEAPTGDIGFAGFRLLTALNRPDHFDELCSFLGASYFRALGRGHVYGLSARGLAIRTADPAGEEFPAFTAFWIERPAPDASAIIVHALLESASLTGAYRFRIAGGEVTTMEVSAQLHPRVDVPRIGIAPGTSMFYFGPADRSGIVDWRPAVHDSDGLLMQSGRGEQIWRPLANPRALQVSGFQDAAPRGFGLMQRRRGFADFEDLEAQYHRRPGLWVEPLEDWGLGEVTLVEIPTRSEMHDNIVAAWTPAVGLRAGQKVSLRYRLHWLSAPVAQQPLLRFSGTRLGKEAEGGPLRIVLDTTTHGGDMPEPKVEASAGTIGNIVLQPNAETGGLRLSFNLRPGSARLVDLRVRLVAGTTPVSESWIHRWTA